jgi:hypothetical protein
LQPRAQALGARQTVILTAAPRPTICHVVGTRHRKQAAVRFGIRYHAAVTTGSIAVMPPG